jgi:hypothetical protein
VAKNRQNRCPNSCRFEMEERMRIAGSIIAGAVAALAALTIPVLAKDTGVPKSEEKATSSSCHAYEQAPDGSWRPLPCEEVGPNGQTQHKGAARSREEEPR